MKAISVLTVLVLIAISTYFTSGDNQVTGSIEDTVDSSMSASEHVSEIPL